MAELPTPSEVGDHNVYARPVCAELGRWEFQFLLTPLRVVVGSGSPVHPIAVF